jgi:hypothetical protein
MRWAQRRFLGIGVPKSALSSLRPINAVLSDSTRLLRGFLVTPDLEWKRAASYFQSSIKSSVRLQSRFS